MVMRYEPVTINTVTNGTDEFGQQTTTIAQWFVTRAVISNVSNALRIAEKYRVYNDIVHMKLNWTPNSQTIAGNTKGYAMTWRGQDWRISEGRVTDDRMHVVFLCYRNDPGVPV